MSQTRQARKQPQLKTALLVQNRNRKTNRSLAFSCLCFRPVEQYLSAFIFSADTSNCYSVPVFLGYTKHGKDRRFFFCRLPSRCPISPSSFQRLADGALSKCDERSRISQRTSRQICAVERCRRLDEHPLRAKSYFRPVVGRPPPPVSQRDRQCGRTWSVQRSQPFPFELF